MGPLSSIQFPLATLFALGTAALILPRWREQTEPDRALPVDGLRGLLALSVFLYHASIWYFYLRTDRWAPGDTGLFTHLGGTSVALFFMITSFLFYSKILDGRERRIDWLRLYVSRMLRMAPLYLLAMVLMVTILSVLSQGELREPGHKLLMEFAHWCAFTILAAPDVNGVVSTSIITAGVTWSLSYEWFFYLLLPLLALTAGVIPPARALCSAAVCAIVVVHIHPSMLLAAPFVGGIGAAVACRSKRFRRIAVQPLGTMVTVTALLIAYFETGSRSALGLVLLSVAFAFIAAGNSIFGILTLAALRLIGAISYSIYLMHGILLYCVFKFMLSRDQGLALSPAQHSMLILALVPVLVLVCVGTYLLVERPATELTTRVSCWLRLRIAWTRD